MNNLECDTNTDVEMVKSIQAQAHAVIKALGEVS